MWIMRTTFLIVLILAFGIAEADARRHHHHHRHYSHYAIERYAPPSMPGSRYSPPSVRYGAPPPRRDESRLRTQTDAAWLIPPGWQLQPPDPDWKGRRYQSPDGIASVAFYSTAVGHEPIAAHMKAIAFVDGEQITYLRSERDWIAVSGLKGYRMFYRKAALACGGKTWHHVAFEYPAENKSSMDGLVTHVARALDDYENFDCDPALSASQPRLPDRGSPATTGAAPERGGAERSTVGAPPEWVAPPPAQ